MSLRTLEGVLRRIYHADETLGRLIDRMENDSRLVDLAGVLSYFKDVRNKVAHPDKLSSKSEAESTFQMMKRLSTEIMKSQWRITRAEGIALLAMYGAFIVISIIVL